VNRAAMDAIEREIAEDEARLQPVRINFLFAVCVTICAVSEGQRTFVGLAGAAIFIDGLWWLGLRASLRKARERFVILNAQRE
jgi:hypothetical protein